MSLLFLGLGLAVLTAGAELLVRGASRLASAIGVSPLVVGLTVVAYGTSMPEFVVSVQSSLQARPEIALGNVVGSNTFNVLFILGLSAVVTPLVVSRQLVRFDVPLMLLVSVVVLLMALDGSIGVADGAILAAGLVAYTTRAILQGRREQRRLEPETPSREVPATMRDTVIEAVYVAGGLGLLVLGSRWFCDSAVEIARGLGISELVIGSTIVAAGTSLPEVFTSVLAALRNERDIAVGNVVGSNLFNLLGVLGAASLVGGGMEIPVAALRFDLPVMLLTGFACLPIFFTGHRVSRWEGALFLAYYVAYTTWLVLREAEGTAAGSFAVFIVGFAAPVTAITLVTSVVRAVREGASSRGPNGDVE